MGQHLEGRTRPSRGSAERAQRINASTEASSTQDPRRKAREPRKRQPCLTTHAGPGAGRTMRASVAVMTGGVAATASCRREDGFEEHSGRGVWVPTGIHLGCWPWHQSRAQDSPQRQPHVMAKQGPPGDAHRSPRTARQSQVFWVGKPMPHGAL